MYVNINDIIILTSISISPIEVSKIRNYMKHDRILRNSSKPILNKKYADYRVYHKKDK